jgi:release factor glutamine methyltransferase
VNEAELVASHILNCDRLSLYLNKDKYLDQKQSAELLRIFKRRTTGEPLQYILGEVEFMGLKFKVDSRALIPRPETEILVESAINKLKFTRKTDQPKILDLGTGSGCIAVAIAKLLPQGRIWALDISDAALALARENAALHKVNIRFLRSDIFSGLEKEPVKFDLIVSNPPYIGRGEFKNLAKEISFEPAVALEAGDDGLDFYRRIISRACLYLEPGGYLALEVGSAQAEKVEEICARHNFNATQVIEDYNNIKRVVITQLKDFDNG